MQKSSFVDITFLDGPSAIRHVLTARSHFAVFGLPAPTDGDDFQLVEAQVVRRRYRTLALQIHPDKCASELAEKATEAFKRLSKANDCLGDSSSQAAYISSLASFKRGARGTKRKQPPKPRPRQSRPRPPPKAPPIPKRRSRPWWEGKSWDELEAELQRQEEAFMREQRDELEKQRKRQAVQNFKKHQKKEKNDERVRKGVRAIFRHKGIDIFDYNNLYDDSIQLNNSSGGESKVNDVKDCDPFNSALQGLHEEKDTSTTDSDIVPKISTSEDQQHEYINVNVPNPDQKSSSASTTEIQEHRAAKAEAMWVCLLCQRQFKSDRHLQRHIHTSKLHAQNVAYADFMASV